LKKLETVEKIEFIELTEKKETDNQWNGVDIEWTEKIGGNGGSEFIEKSDEKGKLFAKGFNLSKNNDYISLVQAIWSNGSVGTEHGKENFSNDKIDCGEGERITKIILRGGQYIDSLEFVTNKGNSCKHGGYGGDEHIFDFTGKIIVAIKGRSGDWFDSIQFGFVDEKVLVDEVIVDKRVDEWKFIQGIDYPGEDLGNLEGGENKTLSELIEKAESLGANCFNTNGWMKKIKFEKWTDDESKGLYVKDGKGKWELVPRIDYPGEDLGNLEGGENKSLSELIEKADSLGGDCFNTNGWVKKVKFEKWTNDDNKGFYVKKLN